MSSSPSPAPDREPKVLKIAPTKPAAAKLSRQREDKLGRIVRIIIFGGAAAAMAIIWWVVVQAGNTAG